MKKRSSKKGSAKQPASKKQATEMKPIPFVQSVDGKFVVTQKAEKLLKKITGKVAIVCVAGPYRTGKSFLLNRLIGRQSGFQVGNTVKACTKGIWLWGEPVKHEGVSYIFLDSEGLGSIEQSQTFDTQIFSLAILLSSLFVLNTQGTINESALEQLDLVVECAKQIKISEDEKQNDKALGAHFPNFLWVLRDFTLQLRDDDGNEINSTEYLEQCLTPQAKGRRGVQEKNRIRETIRNVFPNRDCITLVRPVADEDQLQNLCSMRFEDMRQTFQDQMEHLRDEVFLTGKPKDISGAYINGASLVGLARQYTEAINTGAMPTIHSAWNSVVQVQGQEALERAVKAFANVIEEAFEDDTTTLDTDELQQLFKVADKKANSVLQKRAVGTFEFKAALQETLLSKTADLKASRVTMNKLISKDRCQQLIEQVWAKVNIESKIKTLKDGGELQKLRQQVVDKFLQSAVGPCKEQVLSEFLASKDAIIVGLVFDKNQNLMKENQNMVKKLEVQRKNHEKTTNKLEEQVTKLEDKVEKSEAKKTDLQEELMLCKGKVQSVQAQVERKNLDLKRSAQDLETAKAEAKTVTSARNKLERQFNELNSEHKRSLKDIKALESSCSSLEQQSHDSSAKVVELENNVQNHLKQIKQMTKTHKKLEAQVASLKKSEAILQRKADSDVKNAASEMKVLQEKTNKQADDLVAQRAEAGEKQRKLNSKIAEFKAEIRDLKIELRNGGDSLERAEEEAQQENAALKLEIEQLQENEEVLKLKLLDEEAAVQRAEEEAQQENAVLKLEIEELQKNEEEADEAHLQMCRQLKALRDQNKELEVMLETKEEELVGKSEELDQAANAAPVEFTADEIMRRMMGMHKGTENQAPKNTKAQKKTTKKRSKSQPFAELEDDSNIPDNVEEDKGPLSPMAKKRSEIEARRSRKSIMPPVHSNLENPTACTVQQLKSWLTDLNVDFPSKTMKKQFYIDLLYRAEPLLEGQEVPVVGKKGKKKR